MRKLLLLIIPVLFLGAESEITYKGNKEGFANVCKTITSTMGIRMYDCIFKPDSDMQLCIDFVGIAAGMTDIKVICEKASLNASELIDKQYKAMVDEYSQNLQKDLKKNADEIQEAIDEIEKLAREVGGVK